VVELARTTLSQGRQRAATYLLLGDAYFKLMRLTDARQAWQQALSLDPDSAKAKRRLQRLSKRESDPRPGKRL